MRETDVIREWYLPETNLGRTRERKYEVAVLAVGAMEPHNRHLPYGTDWFTARLLAERACEAAWPRCESVVCLPAIPFGMTANLMGYPMVVSLSQETLDRVVEEVILSLHRGGLRKFVLINPHGGTDFAPLVRRMMAERDVFIFRLAPAGLARLEGDIFDRPDDHGGQVETSIALAEFADLVELEQAGDGSVRPWRLRALREGWIRSSRDFARLCEDCAAGSPEGASALLGERYLDGVVERLAEFLVELAGAEIDESFPFEDYLEPYEG
jgi:creatinine amidohydrolase